MPGRHIERDKAKEAILQCLRAGNTRKASYEYAQIDQDTFYQWLKDQKFRNQVVAAEAHPHIANVTVVNKAAAKDWRAAAWWLERKYPDTWKERKELSLRDLSTEQLLELVRRGEGDPESAGDRLAAGINEPAAAGEPDRVPE